MAIWLALAFADAGGNWGGEKKQMHLIYSSIRMEINGLCLSDTPPPSTLTISFPTTGILPTASVKWTPAGMSCPTVGLNTVIPVYSNDMITPLKIKRLSFLRKSPVCCETRLEQFVYEEDGLRCRLAAVKFYRAYSGVQYGSSRRHRMPLSLSKWDWWLCPRLYWLLVNLLDGYEKVTLLIVFLRSDLCLPSCMFICRGEAGALNMQSACATRAQKKGDCRLLWGNNAVTWLSSIFCGWYCEKI